MVIEYTNTKTQPHRSFAVTLFVVSATVILFIPTTLVVLGYYSNQPTGNLISPLPQGVLTEITPTPSTEENNTSVIIASDNISTPSSTTPSTQGNSQDYSITLPATKVEIQVENPELKEYSQILLIPQNNDKSVYFIKSKADGSFILSADSATTTDRLVDYQIVNP